MRASLLRKPDWDNPKDHMRDLLVIDLTNDEAMTMIRDLLRQMQTNDPNREGGQYRVESGCNKELMKGNGNGD